MAIPTFQNYVSRRTGSAQSILIHVELEGMGDLMTAMEAYMTGGLNALGRSLYAEALLIMYAAKRLTPVRYGFLRASGHIYPPVITDRRVDVIMGFGGPAGWGNVGETNAQAVGYALPVHENMDAYHPVGQAKYLEQPFLAALSGLESRVAIRFKQELKL